MTFYDHRSVDLQRELELLMMLVLYVPYDNERSLSGSKTIPERFSGES